VQSDDHGLVAEPMETVVRLCWGLEGKMQVVLAERVTTSREAAFEGTKTKATREERAAHTAD